MPLCDFPYEVLDGFAHEEPPLYPVEKFADALREIAMWLLNDGRFQERGVADRAMVFAFYDCTNSNRLHHPSGAGREDETQPESGE